MGTADPRIEERVGSTLNDKWTLEKLLGQGGMAAVYQAKHRNGARAAVKMLHPELTRHTNVRERFLREGYAANKVEHRGVVQVLDDDVVKEGPDDGAAYLVMELLEGESLHERMERPPPPSDRELLEIMIGVLDVLEMAHERGVIHRDLKPDNLFLARDPNSGAVRVKVLDFGLARIVEAESVTVDGLALGTPHFMSPEQAGGIKDEIDGRTDIFALGATWFTIVAGRHVHEADNTIGVVVKMATEPAPPIRSVAPTVSEPIAKIIDRALQFKREDRYANAATMRADVDAALRALDMGSAPTVELYATSRKTLTAAAAGEANDGREQTIALSGSDLEPVETKPTEVDSDSPRSRPRPRRRGGFPVFKVGVVIAAACALWVYWPEIRARVGNVTPGTLPSAIVDAGATAMSELLSSPDATTTVTAADDAGAATDMLADASADAEAALLAAADAGDAGDEDDDDDAGPTVAEREGGTGPAPAAAAPHPWKPARKKPPKPRPKPRPKH